jgi:AcrR family transcriptional regulator
MQDPAAMRITAEAKSATKQRIIEAAATLFSKTGWDNTTTRDIASAAEIATGTLFNYFDTKESVAAALMSEELESAYDAYRKRRTAQDSLEEELFSFIWTTLRGLRPHKRFVGRAAESMFTPLARASRDRAGDDIQSHHLKTVEQIILSHGISGPLPAVTMQLYWTLYLGILAYWAADKSPHQEDTLALLDHSLKFFIASLEGGTHEHKAKRTHRGTSRSKR